MNVDVVVLGSGIGGSTVAAILAKQGVRVALIDAAVHPRFALGKSTIGETSFLLRQMAARIRRSLKSVVIDRPRRRFIRPAPARLVGRTLRRRGVSCRLRRT